MKFHACIFNDLFCLLNIFWYVALQVHTVLFEISFLRDSQTPAILGENLPKQLLFKKNTWELLFCLGRGHLCNQFQLLRVGSHSMSGYSSHQRMGLMCI